MSTGNHLNGWSAGADVPISGILGAFGRVDGGYGATFKTGAILVPAGAIDRSPVYDVVGGPRVAWTAGRVSPWEDAAVGVTHVTARSTAIDALVPVTDTAFTAGVGGGVDFRMTGWLDVRIVDVEYRHATIFNQTLNRTTVSVGAVLRR